MAITEADILSKYDDVFPTEFIEAVREGVSWLCSHNGITYQTSIMVASDKIIYNTANASILRIGLVDVNNPLTGLTYYEVKSIEKETDTISGNTIFTVKLKYTTPMGITVTLLPIMFYDANLKPDIYTKEQVDALIKELTTKIDAITPADSKTVLDLATRVNECVTKDDLTTALVDYVKNTDLTTNLANYQTTTVADGKYATKTDLDAKVNTTDFETYKGTVYTKTEADAAFQAK